MYNYWLERKKMNNLNLTDSLDLLYTCFSTELIDSNYFQITTDEIENYKLNLEEFLKCQDYFNSCLENIESWTESYIHIDHI
jgi:hypothetical protein